MIGKSSFHLLQQADIDVEDIVIKKPNINLKDLPKICQKNLNKNY